MRLEKVPGGVSAQPQFAMRGKDVKLGHDEVRIAGAGSSTCNKGKTGCFLVMQNEIGPAPGWLLPIGIEIGIGPGDGRIGAELVQVRIQHLTQGGLI